MRRLCLTGLLAFALILGLMPQANADERLLRAHRLCIEYFEKLFDLEGRLDLPAIEMKGLSENEFVFNWNGVMKNIRTGEYVGPLDISCGGYYDTMKIVMISINEDFYFDDEIPQP
jgi:hypothetical protein